LGKTRQLIWKPDNKDLILFEKMPLGIVLPDEDSKVTYANSAAEQILCHTRNQILDITAINKNLKPIHEDGSNYLAEEHPTMVSIRTGKPIEYEIMGIYVPLEDDYSWKKIKKGKDIPALAFCNNNEIL
jgi:PAS domain-containing protein